MTEKEMEEEVDIIVEEIWQEMMDTNLEGIKNRLKMAVVNGYKAGMEAARKVFTSY